MEDRQDRQIKVNNIKFGPEDEVRCFCGTEIILKPVREIKEGDVIIVNGHSIEVKSVYTKRTTEDRSWQPLSRPSHPFQ